MKALRLLRLAAPLLVAPLLVSACSSSTPGAATTASAASSGVVLTPGPGSTYRNGEQIRVSVGPNKRFTPYLRVEILECADPGGSAAHLPKSNFTCDGDTVPDISVLVNKDGSFSDPSYTLYSLPNTALSEPYDGQPRCDLTHECVLYVGLNQEDFTQPKLFSAPFRIAPTASSTPKKP